MRLAAAIDRLKILYEQADDTDYDSDSDSDFEDHKQRARIRINPRLDISQFWTANFDSGDVDEEQLLYLLRDLRSNATESSSADHNNNMNMTSELPPAIEQTIGRNTEDAGIDPEVPISLCYSSDLALERGLQVENREAMETSGGLVISAADLEDSCKPESIRIRLPTCHLSNSAQPIFKLLPRRTECPPADNRLETTTLLGNACDFRGKPIIRLPIRQIENQPLGQVHMMDNNHIATESIERLEKRTTEELAIPERHLGMQSEPICLELDRPPVLVRAVAAEDNMATVERTLPFARTSSAWDPGWKQVREYTGHGRASAGGVSEHQGNGEEPGVGREEELGDEQAEAQKLQVTKEEVGGMRGEETRGAKKAREGGKVANPEVEGATCKSLRDNPGDPRTYREWDPGQGTAMADDLHGTTAGDELVPHCHGRSQLDTGLKEQQSIEGEQADIFSWYSWPPPDQVLERYRVSEESLAKLNLQLQRWYSLSENLSEEGKNLTKLAQYPTPLQGEQPCGAAAASGDNRGLGTADANPAGRIAVKDNWTYNPAIVATISKKTHARLRPTVVLVVSVASDGTSSIVWQWHTVLLLRVGTTLHFASGRRYSLQTQIFLPMPVFLALNYGGIYNSKRCRCNTQGNFKCSQNYNPLAQYIYFI